MRSMRLVARALAAALVVCAGAEEMVEVFLASDRVIAAAATLNSVCDSAAEPSGLRLHVVAPSMAEAAALEDATTHACGEASFVAWGLPELEAAIREDLKTEPMWTTELSRVPRFGRASPYAVPVGRWDADAKHASPFNHARFYYPELLTRRSPGARRLVMLDDDVIVRGDVADVRVEEAGKALAAGCQSWYVDAASSRLASSTTLSYLDVPFFGFGTLSAARPAAAAACGGGGGGARECVPVVGGSPLGFFAKLGSLERLAKGVAGRGRWAFRAAEAASDALGVGGGEASGADFLAALGASRAWNFGLVAVDVGAWHAAGLTARYERWLEANAQREVWPSDSLAFGLGLPFLALRGEVACFEDATEDPKVTFEQGLGVAPWGASGRALASLDEAFALHWNGDRKPWDVDKCDNETRPFFLEALAQSPDLLARHLADAGGGACKAAASAHGPGRALYGMSSVSGTPWSSYYEAYLWAEDHYRVSTQVATSVDECYDVCRDLFPEDNGTLACPTTELELELLRDIFWEPGDYGWLGIYRDGAFDRRCGAWGKDPADVDSLLWAVGAPDNGGSCQIEEMCTVLLANAWETTTAKWADGSKETWYTGNIIRNQRIDDKSCGTGRLDVPSKTKNGDDRVSYAHRTSPCLCENSKPAAGYDYDVLDDLAIASPGHPNGSTALTCDDMLVTDTWKSNKATAAQIIGRIIGAVLFFAFCCSIIGVCGLMIYRIAPIARANSQEKMYGAEQTPAIQMAPTGYAQQPVVQGYGAQPQPVVQGYGVQPQPVVQGYGAQPQPVVQQGYGAQPQVPIVQVLGVQPQAPIV